MSKKKAAKARQCAAIPYVIRDSAVLVLVLTSRGTGRWIIPKGWVKKRHRPPEMAALEAFEEGGVVGVVTPRPLGTYSYLKTLNSGDTMPLTVDVFGLHVQYEALEWPERGQRRRAWVTPEEAATMVDEPELRDLFLRFPVVEREARAAFAGSFLPSPAGDLIPA